MQQMKLIRLISILLAAMPLYAQSATLHIKPGAWEYTLTSTTTVSSSMLPPERLKSLPPELLEKMTKPTTVTTSGKSCVKNAESIESAFDEKKLGMKCERKNVTRTSTSYEADLTCTPRSPNGKEKTFRMHVKVEAPSPESVTSTADSKSSFGTSHAVTKSHWLGASCAGIPEHD
jgi:hypothetical protein